MSDVTHEDLHRISDEIDRMDFDHPFRLHADGSIEDAPNVRAYWVPEIAHDPHGDVTIYSDTWKAMTGLTGQHGYNGAVLHPSEVMSCGVVGAMLRIVENAEHPVAFALTEVRDEDLSHPETPIGWAILYTGEVPA